MLDTTADGTNMSNFRQTAFAALAIVLALLVGVAVSQFPMNDESGEAPAVNQPLSSVKEKQSPIQDSEPVIGVSIGTRHRAYPLADLWAPDRHILNDLFDETPLSVTFCNLDNCVKAFTDNTRSDTLELSNGGANPRKARKMLLIVQGRAFEQDTLLPLDGDTEHPFPYQPVDAIRTTWGKWRAAHPETELRANGQLYAPGTW